VSLVIKPSSTLKRLRQILLLLVTCALAGGHWFGLQLVAWSGMLIDYSAEVGFVQAVDQTFDGAHPCDLCSAIKTAQNETREMPADHNLRPFTAVLTKSIDGDRSRDGLWEKEAFPFPEDESGERRSLRPASPPPRA